MLLLTTTLCTLLRDTRYLAGAMLMISLFYVSCGRQRPQPVATTGGEQHGPVTVAERSLVNRIRDVSAVLQSVYHDPAALAEVNAAIASGYYHDERVLLADLLYPKESSLYHFMTQRKDESKTPGEGAPQGAFAKKFRQVAPDVLGKQRADDILALAAGAGTFPRDVIEQQTKPHQPAALGISIYHPYSSDFSMLEQPLIVPATVEADWVDIPAPDCNLPHHHDGISCNQIRVDDAYAMENPVHIIGLGAVPANGPAMGSTIKSNPDLTLESTPDSRFIGLRPAIRVTETLPPDSVPALIYLGRVRCSRQFDRFISFTGNGGGSELKFIRGEAYVTLNNDQQVINTEFDVITVYFRRKDIRKEREKDVYAIWDSNWEPERTEQVFGIYEEDTRGELEFSGSVRTELEHPGGESAITPIEYSYSVYSQDEIIRQINWSRTSFFYNNQRNLAGCGFKNNFTWYDCRLPVAYSLPAGN